MEIIGIDIGATGIKAAIVDTDKGEFLTERKKLDTPDGGKPKDILKVIQRLVDHFEWKGKIGCGFPGIIKNGVVKSTANISKSWMNMPVSNYFSKEIGCPFSVANDADLAGLAEVSFGKGKGVLGTLIFITIGTGLGSGIFVDGKLVPNTEMGHLYYKKSVFEHYASNSARKKKEMSWQDWAVEFSAFLNHLDLLFSPSMILLGGGVSKRFSDWGEFLDTKVNVDAASLQNDAGIIGAAMLALES